MTFYTLSFDRIIWRFYLMMFVVVGSFSIGIPALAILSLPIFLSTIMGVSFKTDPAENQATQHMTTQPPSIEANRTAA